MTKQTLSALMFLTLLAGTPTLAHAQRTSQQSATQAAKICQGTVVDESGEPIIGASVVLKGTTQGSITDIDGHFELNQAKKGSTIVVSFIGYTTQEVIYTGEAIAITLLEESKQMDDVVVVAYGTQKKSSVTGAIVSTKGADLTKVPTSNITNSLAGRMPGLVSYNRSGEPGYDDATLLIRGASTTGDASPLVVVDGVADRAGSLGRIDPNDIESISILKDGSAAIYGSRAANGVILVTTKRGRKDRIQVNYTGNVGVSTPTILPEMCSSAEYAELLNELNPGSYSAEQIQKFRDGSDPLAYPNTDAMGDMLRPAVQTQHNVSASGGNDRISFYASLGYKFQDNYYKNSASDYNQYNLRTNVDFKVNRDLSFGLNVSYRQEHRNSPVYGSEDIWRYLLKFNPMVNIYFPGTDFGTTSSKQDNFAPATGMDDTMGIRKNQQTYMSTDLTMHLDMPWITKGLSVDAGIYVDQSDIFSKNWQKKYYLYEQDGANGYNPVQQGQNVLDENTSKTLGITFNTRINYKRQFADKHNVGAMVAYEQYTSRYDYLYARRQDFISTSIDELFAGDANSATNDGKASETGRVNYFGRFDYDYDGRYILQFNWRVDGSENFPKGNRFGFFPGVSVGWRVSEENWWKEHVADYVDMLKLRGSWAQMGNDKVSAFQYMTTYTFNNPAILNGSTQTGLALLRTANPNITWEVANTLNFGIEARFLRDWNFELELFKTKRNNILTTRDAAIAEFAGLTLPDENIGKVSNKGVEVTLGWGKRLNRDWSVNVSGNFSYNHSEIEFIDEPAATLDWQRRTGLSIGTTSDLYLMYEADGIFRSQQELDSYPHLSNARVGDVRFRDVNGDNVIDSNDKVRQDKPAVPRIMYGLNMAANWRNLSLTMLWQGAAQTWQYTFMEAGTIGNYTKDFYNNRWTEANPNAKYPRTYNRDSTVTGAGSYRNTFWLENASYLRLKSLELSYSLPKQWYSNAHIADIRLSLSGYNLLTFSGIENIDPETENNSQGWAAWNTPQNKVYNFGVNITF